MQLMTGPRFYKPVQTRINQVVRFASAQKAECRELDETQLRDLAKQTSSKVQGQGISGRINFRLETDFPLNSDQASTIQMFRGFHPCGYDFFFGGSQQQESGKYLTTWKCSTSCD